MDKPKFNFKEYYQRELLKESPARSGMYFPEPFFDTTIFNQEQVPELLKYKIELIKDFHFDKCRFRQLYNLHQDRTE